MASIESLLELFERLRSVDIAVDSGRCVQVRNRNAGCRRCAAACTGGAIALEGDELAVDPSRCIGCGTCATVCPTGALQALHPDDRELFGAVREAMKANGGQAVIACSQIVQAAGARVDTQRLVAVECLGRVDESLLLGALAAPWATGATLVCGRCESCPRKPGHDVSCQVAATANNLLEAWKSTARVELASRFPSSVRADAPAQVDAARRAFFFRMGDDARQAAGAVAGAAVDETLGAQDEPAPKLEKVRDDGRLPHAVPARRRRLVATLAALGAPDDVLVDGRLWGNVIVDADACKSCRMCAVFCPTGALEPWDGEGAFGLLHRAQRCVKCRTCESICPAAAITISEQVFASDIADGMVERIPLAPPMLNRGDSHATKQVFRTLLGTEDIWDR